MDRGADRTEMTDECHAGNGPAARAVEALQQALGERLIAVVLFGSRARGDCSPHSDWDLLVLVEDLPERALERHMFLTQLLPPDCRGAVSLLAKTPEEFESALPPLYLDIALDGRVLYDSLGYVAERLEALQRLMERAGLYRERVEGGDVWRWRAEPALPWALHWDS